jgi:uncharacterized protein (TIGR02271 family)
MSDVVNFGRRTANTAEHSANKALDAAMSTGMAWWDLMLKMQRASLQSISSYSPTTDTRISGSLPQRSEGVAVIPVGEERLNVATRTVQGETTRIRRRVVAQPVEQEVTLREETVVVERRPAQPGAGAAAPAARGNVLTETVVEMSDSRQVPAVWKSVHVAEEVVLRKQVTERKERVRETLRRDVVEVEHDRDEAAPVVSLTHEAKAEAAPRREAEAARHRVEEEAEAARHRAESQAEAARHRAESQAEPPAAEARRHEDPQQDRKPMGQGPQAPQPGGRKG